MATDSTGTRSVHNTLTGTTVDTVNLQGYWAAVEIINRSAVGDPLWVMTGIVGDTNLVAPVAAANECDYVPAGTSVIIPNVNGATIQFQVKILGNGNDYSVVGLSHV